MLKVLVVSILLFSACAHASKQSIDTRRESCIRLISIATEDSEMIPSNAEACYIDSTLKDIEKCRGEQSCVRDLISDWTD